MRANTGGNDDATGMPPPGLPELPISPHTNLVTASGLAQLQGSMIERVEIITNPSARYEAEGMGGVINIVLKK